MLRLTRVPRSSQCSSIGTHICHFLLPLRHCPILFLRHTRRFYRSPLRAPRPTDRGVQAQRTSPHGPRGSRSRGNLAGVSTGEVIAPSGASRGGTRGQTGSGRSGSQGGSRGYGGSRSYRGSRRQGDSRAYTSGGGLGGQRGSCSRRSSQGHGGSGGRRGSDDHGDGQSRQSRPRHVKAGQGGTRYLNDPTTGGWRVG